MNESSSRRALAALALGLLLATVPAPGQDQRSYRPATM